MKYTELELYLQTHKTERKQFLKQQMLDPKLMFKVKIWPSLPDDLKTYCQTIKANNYLEVYGFPITYDYPLDDEVMEYIEKKAKEEKATPVKTEKNSKSEIRRRLIFA